MKRLSALISNVVHLIKNHQMQEILKKIQSRFYSDHLSYGLRRDLTVPFETPESKIPITVRPLQDHDVPQLFDTDDPQDTGRSNWELVYRKFLNADIQTCYVGVTIDNTPCYTQWLVGPHHNDQMQKLFHGIYPRLAVDEALLENAFTLESYRGKRIMPCAMAQIAEKAHDIGARWVVTFVAHTNIPSLKGCERSGFMPYIMRRERWLFFRRQLSFTPLPEGTPYPYSAGIGTDG